MCIFSTYDNIYKYYDHCRAWTINGVILSTLQLQYTSGALGHTVYLGLYTTGIWTWGEADNPSVI